MTAQEVERVVEHLCEAEPFKEFTIEFRDGRDFKSIFPWPIAMEWQDILVQWKANTFPITTSVNRIIAAPAKHGRIG